jgi:hypothetical protein
MRALFALLLLICKIIMGSAADPTFDPDIVRDGSGNSADEKSNITWGGLPDGKPYQSKLEFDDQGLDPYYSIMHGFINTVQPNEFPYSK